jgi:hypothetical protein
MILRLDAGDVTPTDVAQAEARQSLGEGFCQRRL